MPCPPARTSLMHRTRLRLMTRLLLPLALLTSFAAVPAHAIPGVGEFYAGLGTRTFGGFFGQNPLWAPTLEVGLDNISLIKGVGVGLRVDLPIHTDPLSVGSAYSLEARYTVFSIPFLRGFAGISGGVKQDVGLTGLYSVFAGLRASLGLPYLAFTGGMQGVKTDLYGFGQITIGVAL